MCDKKTKPPAAPVACPNDTNNDGDCHLCVRTGGCPLRGGCAAAVFVAPRTDRALRVIYNADPESSEAQRARDELRSIEATLTSAHARLAAVKALCEETKQAPWTETAHVLANRILAMLEEGK